MPLRDVEWAQMQNSPRVKTTPSSVGWKIYCIGEMTPREFAQLWPSYIHHLFATLRLLWQVLVRWKGGRITSPGGRSSRRRKKQASGKIIICKQCHYLLPRGREGSSRTRPNQFCRLWWGAGVGEVTSLLLKPNFICFPSRQPTSYRVLANKLRKTKWSINLGVSTELFRGFISVSHVNFLILFLFCFAGSRHSPIK